MMPDKKHKIFFSLMYLIIVSNAKETKYKSMKQYNTCEMYSTTRINA